MLIVIKETGYKPNYATRMLRTQQSDISALLIPKVEQSMPTNMFFMDVLSGPKIIYKITAATSLLPPIRKAVIILQKLFISMSYLSIRLK